MLGKLNFTLLPTKSDVLWVTNEIRMTERKLKDLERDMEMLKAWIAPIRRLNTDTLSLVFEKCGENDWKTPLRIAAVSRGWRNLVIATPRAWQFLNLKSNIFPEAAHTFFDRSGQRPLHIFLPIETRPRLLAHVATRIRCLSLDGFSRWVIDSFFPVAARISFPNVERLHLRGCYFNTELQDICEAHFPSLRYLVCSGRLGRAADDLLDGTTKLAASLESMPLQTSIQSAWLGLIQNCQDSVVSLKLDLITWYIPVRVQVVLPRLKCLEIYYRSYYHIEWKLFLATPMLETYVERTKELLNSHLLHGDLRTVQALRIDHEITLSNLPKLKVLQMEDISDPTKILAEVIGDGALCPQSQHIELFLRETSIYPTGLLQVSSDIDELNKTRSCPIRHIYVRCDPHPDLPGMIPQSMASLSCFICVFADGTVVWTWPTMQ